MIENINYQIRKLTCKDNAELAEIIRYNLKNHGLDIPGTVYFDPGLDSLSDYYSNSPKRGYYVMVDENDRVIGGIGFDEFPQFQDCAELQKLYLADSVKGRGFGYRLISFIEDKMSEAGYKFSYLETHSNLKAAIHIYGKSGYSKIDRPEGVVHGAMTDFFFKDIQRC